MANNVTGTGNTFNLPNYVGELFTCSPTKTPLLSMIGGLTGGLKTENDEFATGVLYEFPDAAQPEITEAASETAPTATAIAREQKTNVTQIFHEAISITYAKMANRGKLSGLNSAGQTANPANELDWQIARRLEKIARDVEYTFLNGTYQKATSAAEANKTRGMFELCSTTSRQVLVACRDFLYKKSHARLGCSLVNALTTARCRFLLRCPALSAAEKPP